MDMKRIGSVVYVTLSRRNVEQLLTALDRGYTQGICRTCGEERLYVRVEEDADHYGIVREAGPGLDDVLNRPDYIAGRDPGDEKGV